MAQQTSLSRKGNSPYSAVLTREQFLFYEVRITAKLVNEGLSEDLVKEDYLRSNESRELEIDDLIDKFKALSDMSENARSFLTMIGGVLPESADMIMAEIREKYGTYEKYMEKEYGFDEEKLNKFRDMYLE